MTSRSYRISFDGGHAPCPFDNLYNLANATDSNCQELSSKVLTLSNCASPIRKLAGEDLRNPESESYVFGIAGNDLSEITNRLIWVGRLAAVKSKGAYFRMGNIGITRNQELKKGYGPASRPDNFYCFSTDVREDDHTDFAKKLPGNENGDYFEFAVFKNPFHDEADARLDLSVANTLFFEEYWYFGRNAVDIPAELVNPGIGQKPLDDDQVRLYVKELREKYPRYGIYGPPASLDIEVPFEVKELEPPVTWRKYLQWWIKENWSNGTKKL